MEILQKLGTLPIFFIMFLIIYFLMIRPQIKQLNNHLNLINNLKKGDKVITRGGICGKILDFQGENKIILLTNESSKLTILKSYIASIDQ